MEELFAKTSNVSLDVFVTKMIDLEYRSVLRFCWLSLCSLWDAGSFGD